jgi:hypothetical protein
MTNAKNNTPVNNIQQSADTNEALRFANETLKTILDHSEVVSQAVSESSNVMIDIHAKATNNDETLKAIEKTVNEDHQLQKENKTILTTVNKSSEAIEKDVATVRKSAEDVSTSNLNLMENFAQQADIWEKTITTSNEAYTNEVIKISELLTTIQTKVDEQDPRELLDNLLDQSKELKEGMSNLVEQQRKDTQSFKEQLDTNKTDMKADTDRLVAAVEDIKGYNQNFDTLQASLEAITLRLSMTEEPTDEKPASKQA